MKVKIHNMNKLRIKLKFKYKRNKAVNQCYKNNLHFINHIAH